ncbi:hypothetical protein KAR52_00010 [Candidatus Pacearchaeota archaeon]|nr:hypothetical protein [Candidatus Pacearchaeota archaeon]MCK5150031.1 hypothetical protein [Candidatus Pacearchaeota archaeon]
MALEFICSNEIILSKEIEIPRSANHYKLKSGKIKFFYVNSFFKEMREIPIRARTMVFDDFLKTSYLIDYGEPAFYDEERNILKYCKGIRLWTK